MRLLFALALLLIGSLHATTVHTLTLGGTSSIGDVGSLTNAVSPPSCETVWADCTSSINDIKNRAVANLAQKIKVASGVSVCKLRVSVQAGASPATVTWGFWSNSDGTGTQYGTSSQEMSIPGDSGYHELEVTWDTAAPLTTDCYLVPSYASFYWYFSAASAGGTYYEDTTYCMYVDGSSYGGGQYDFVFKLTVQ